MFRHLVGLRSLDWTPNLRDVNGLVLVAGVLCATIIVASANEVKFQRLASEIAASTKTDAAQSMKLAHCPLGSQAKTLTQ